MFADTILIKILTLHEGRRNKPYLDSVGKWTVGVGRNLTDVGLSKNEVIYLLQLLPEIPDGFLDYLLQNDLGRVRTELDQALPWWREMDDVRQAALIDLGFNLGVVKLLTFVHSLKLLEDKRFVECADNLLKTRWAVQVGVAPGQRAYRVTEMIRTGLFDSAIQDTQV